MPFFKNTLSTRSKGPFKYEIQEHDYNSRLPYAAHIVLLFTNKLCMNAMGTMFFVYLSNWDPRIMVMFTPQQPFKSWQVFWKMKEEQRNPMVKWTEHRRVKATETLLRTMRRKSAERTLKISLTKSSQSGIWTSALIGAGKCNFSCHSRNYMTNRRTWWFLGSYTSNKEY